MSSITGAEGVSERRLLFKIDLFLMPIMIAYGLQFYDKAILSSASIFGILQDLELSTPILGSTKVSLTRYSTAISAFYWGYLVAALPMALLVQRFRPNYFLGSAVILWGIIVILIPAITSWRGLIAQRLFLGFVESAVSPGFVLITKSWYRRSEQPPVKDDDSEYDPKLVSDSKPGSLVQGKQSGLVDEVAIVSSPTVGKSWKLYQIKEAFLDYKIWFFFLQAISICNGGVTAFGAYIIKSFGYSSLRSIVLQTPGGATTCISIYLSTFIALKVKNPRSILLMLTCLLVMVGAIMIWKSDWTNRAVLLAGYYLLPIFGAPFVLMLSLSTANIAGTTKQSIASAMIFVGCNVGNIVAPYLTKAEQAPIHYRDTFVAIITCMASTIGLTALLDAGMWYQNRKRDQRKGESREKEEEEKRRAVEEDLTDWENPHFRYAF